MKPNCPVLGQKLSELNSTQLKPSKPMNHWNHCFLPYTDSTLFNKIILSLPHLSLAQLLCMAVGLWFPWLCDLFLTKAVLHISWTLKVVLLAYYIYIQLISFGHMKFHRYILVVVVRVPSFGLFACCDTCLIWQVCPGVGCTEGVSVGSDDGSFPFLCPSRRWNKQAIGEFLGHPYPSMKA